MKRLRWIVRIVTALATVAGLAVLAAIYLFNSEPFARWVLETAASRSEGSVEIESVTGTLSSGVALGRVDVDLDFLSAQITDVEVTVDWRSIVARSVIIDSLDIGRVEARLQTSDVSSTSAAPTELAVLVLVRRLRIGEIGLVDDEQSYIVSDAALQLRVLRNRFELAMVSASWVMLRVTGDAAFTLTEDLAIDASVCIDGAFADELVRGCVAAEGQPEALQVDAQVQLPFTASAVGRVELSESGLLDLAVNWQDARLNAVPDVSSAFGTMRLSGTFDSLRVAADGAATAFGQAAQFSVDTRILGEAFEVARVRLEQDGTSAEFSGTVTRDLASLDGALELSNVDPRSVSDRAPAGDLDLQGRLSAQLQPELRISATDLVVSGELSGVPVIATGAGDWEQDSLTIDALQVVSRADTIDVSGRIADRLEVDAVGSIGDISAFLPEVGGSLSLEARITGPRLQPFVSGIASFDDLSFGDFAARSMRIAGSAGLAPDDVVDLAISVSDASAYDTPMNESVFALTGTAATHRLDAQLTAGNWSAGLSAQGSLVERVWEGQIDQFRVEPGEFGVWQLLEPVDVSYAAVGYSVDDLCLAYTLSRICASVMVAGLESDSLSVTATNFDVGILAPFVPPGVRARGLVSGRGLLSNFVGSPRGEFEFEAEDAQVDFSLAEGETLDLPIRQLRMAARFDDTTATLSASIDAAESGRAAVAVVVTDPRGSNPGVSGTANLRWNDVAVLEILSPDIDSVTGVVDAQMLIAGTLYAPVLDGTAELAQGAFEVPEWGLVIDGITASATATDSREASFEARGMIDGRPIDVNGTVFLDPQEGWPMQLRLSGENLPLIQLADFEMQVSPDLETNVRLPRIEVSGVVTVPSARIREVTLPQQAVVPSADTVVHGRVIEEQARPLDVVADLTLELGDDIRFEDANIDARVTGRLELDYRSGQGALTQGGLNMTGEYEAFGTLLTLERGELIFVGPWDDPSLDIRATREIAEVTAGVQVTGSLSSPVTNVFSEPAMSEADALSWLLFGRPVDDIRESDSNTLQGAALTLGLQQALPVARIGETLGLDTFAIRATDVDAGEIMAGKYLSPNVYFRYSYGLFNRIGGILLRYRISDRFSLETRSGEHNSMDLFYTVERD